MPRHNRNAEVDFKGEKRSNATHVSTTDPEARLYKKSPGTGAALCFMGHALMENRHGLIVQGELTQADGHAERRAALDMVHRHSPGSTRRLTLGADKGYDAAEFVADLRRMCVTPNVATRHPVTPPSTDRLRRRRPSTGVLFSGNCRTCNPWAWPISSSSISPPSIPAPCPRCCVLHQDGCAPRDGHAGAASQLHLCEPARPRAGDRGRRRPRPRFDRTARPPGARGCVLSIHCRGAGDGMAVVLSGAGADGSNGVRAIRKPVESSLPKEPAEAKFGAMPQNAIATGGRADRPPGGAMARKQEGGALARRGRCGERSASRRRHSARAHGPRLLELQACHGDAPGAAAHAGLPDRQTMPSSPAPRPRRRTSSSTTC